MISDLNTSYGREEEEPRLDWEDVDGMIPSSRSGPHQYSEYDDEDNKFLPGWGDDDGNLLVSGAFDLVPDEGETSFATEAKSTLDSNYTIRSAYEDSPYYHNFIQKEIHSIEIVSLIVNDIRKKAITLGVVGGEMSKAMKSLSLACQIKPTVDATNSADMNNKTTSAAIPKGSNSSGASSQDENYDNDEEIALKQKQDALGSETSNTLHQLGKVLAEMAMEHERMCQNIESVLGSHLDEIIHSQIVIATELKNQAVTETDRTEKLLYSYLKNNGHANTTNVSTDITKLEDYGNGGRVVNSTAFEQQEKQREEQQSQSTTTTSSISALMFPSKKKKQQRRQLSMDLQTSSTHNKQQTRSFPRKGYHRSSSLPLEDGSSSISNESIKRSKSTDRRFRRSTMAHVAVHPNPNTDTLQNMNTRAFEEVICVQQVEAELKRFHLYKFLMDAKLQRELEFTRTLGSFLNAIHTYSIACKDMFSKCDINDLIIHNQQYYETLRLDDSSTDNGNPKNCRSNHTYYNKQQLKSNEKKILETLNMVTHRMAEKERKEKQSDELDVDSRTSTHPNLSISPSSSDNEEEFYDMWDIQMTLAECSSIHMGVENPMFIPHGGGGNRRCSNNANTVVEGWLYEKQQKQQQSHGYFKRNKYSKSWLRRWFKLENGILFGSDESQQQSNRRGSVDTVSSQDTYNSVASSIHDKIDSGTTSIFSGETDFIEICELSTCKIKSIQEGDKRIGSETNRYCFEIVFPSTTPATKAGNDTSNNNSSHNNKYIEYSSIILQARGPKEYNCWMNALFGASRAHHINLLW